MYSSAECEAPRRDVSFQHICKRMWGPFLVNSLYWLNSWGSLDLSSAFWRSVVECPRPTPVGGQCPEGSFFFKGLCAPERRSPLWSGSKHCFDQNYVVSTATALGGKVNMLGNCVLVLAQVLVGTAFLDTVGRKPMLIAGLFGLTLANLMYWLASQLHGELSRVAIMATAWTKIMDTFQAAVKAMVIDESGGDVQVQAVAFSLMNAFQYVAMFVAFAAGYPLLRLNLEEYGVVWAVWSALSLMVVFVACFATRETHNPEEKVLIGAADVEGKLERAGTSELVGGDGPTSRKASGTSELVTAFRLAWEDPLLRGLMLLSLLAPMAIQGCLAVVNGYAIDVVGLSQANASVVGLVQPVAIIMGSCIVAPLTARAGSWNAYCAGLAVASCGFLITAGAASFRQAAMPFFWLGWPTFGFGWGILDPAGLTLVGQLLSPSNSGKLMALKYFLEFVGGAVGSYVWTNHLFTTGDVGWASAAGFVLAAVLFMGLLILTLLLHWQSEFPRP